MSYHLNEEYLENKFDEFDELVSQRKFSEAQKIVNRLFNQGFRKEARELMRELHAKPVVGFTPNPRLEEYHLRSLDDIWG